MAESFNDKVVEPQEGLIGGSCRATRWRGVGRLGWQLGALTAVEAKGHLPPIRRVRLWAAIVGLALTLASPQPAGADDALGSAPSNGSRPAADAGPRRPVDDRYIVVFRKGASREDVRSARDDARRRGGWVHHEYRHALTGFAASVPPQALDGLRRNPKVAYLEADATVAATATQTGATWGLDRIDQRHIPLGSTYTYDFTGSGVRAYIVDSGIRATHTEFAGRASAGFTAVDDGRGTEDCNGHGTHVAGTVGGTTHGVAKKVQLIAVRVLDCTGSGTKSGVIAGIDWLTGDHQSGQPAVANVSLGGSASEALDSAVRNSVTDGVTYTIAAGNASTDTCYDSPARLPEAITVGSTTSSDARSSFSNYGTCLDIFAPGSGITSAWPSSDTATNTTSGTSMASPHVAGVAALYLEANPSASPSAVGTAITTSATPNVVVSAGPGSPNRLVYSLLHEQLSNSDFERYDAAMAYVYDWQTNFDYTGWGGGYQSKVATTGSRVYDVLAYTRTDGGSIASNALAVTPGQTFRIRADAAYVGWPGATHPDGFFFRAWFGNSSDFGRWSPGASFVDLVPADSPMPSVWRTYGGDVTVPIGKTHMRVVLYNWGPQWGANFQFDNVRVSTVG